LNWGYCEDPSNDMKPIDIRVPYKVTIQTSSMDMPETKDPFYV